VSPLAPSQGSTTLPPVDGVRFATAAAGVRYQGRTDLMLAEIAAGSAIAGVFTRSSTRSAPVRWCEGALKAGHQPGRSYALLVNSGNSNAFTGKRGEDAVALTVGAAAAVIGCPKAHVFPASTGVIGEPLPAQKIADALPGLAARLSPAGAAEAAAAIMTTDTYPKGCATEVSLDGVPIRIMGFAKGSGMIAPDMATMLVYLFTDARIAQPVLQEMISTLNHGTFNAITVDGDTSTSDTLICAATGKAPMASIESMNDPRAAAFMDALEAVMLDLAHQVVRDGEGATKFVTINITGAATDASARKIGMAIANSPLVKTALAGNDPNWGRIVMAVGKSGEPADRDKLSIRFGDVTVAENGWRHPDYREEQGAALFKEPEIGIDVDLGIGEGRDTVWTCDLTHGYITINADYRS
ncbi:MAG: bifunctional glutamate N-acetyltransferase/amino-acid acetyltransferase ArgJ, partial [Rubricella sp.]